VAPLYLPQDTFRDVPYDWSTLLENVLDARCAYEHVVYEEMQPNNASQSTWHGVPLGDVQGTASQRLQAAACYDCCVPPLVPLASKRRAPSRLPESESAAAMCPSRTTSLSVTEPSWATT
jgi:hypothetical protein